MSRALACDYCGALAGEACAPDCLGAKITAHLGGPVRAWDRDQADAQAHTDAMEGWHQAERRLGLLVLAVAIVGAALILLGFVLAVAS